MSDFQKKAGGAGTLILAAIPFLLGSWIVGAVLLGLALLWIVGLLLRSDSFPYAITRKDGSTSGAERRELLGLAQAVTTELETCRLRLVEAKDTGYGWLPEQQLPAETYNTRWTHSLLTADRVTVNEALRDFYVLADQLNGQLNARNRPEQAVIGYTLAGRGLPLDSGDLARLDDGLTRNAAAQGAVRDLAGRLHTDETSWIRPLVVGLFLGAALGFGVGLIVLEWKPWKSSRPNQFTGLNCTEREVVMNGFLSEHGPAEIRKAEHEREAAEEREPCRT